MDKNTCIKHCDFIKLKDVCGTSENVHYSVYIKDIPDEFKSYAEKELKETVENKAKGIQELRDFLKSENIPDVEDRTLLIVLRNCKYDVQKSKAKLKRFLQIRSFAFKRVAQLDLKVVERILRDMFFGVLPYRDKHGRGIVFTRPSLNLDLYSVEDLMITGLAAVMFNLDLYPMWSLTGVSYILDSKDGASFIIYQVMKTAAKYIPMWLGIPIRLGRIDMTNEIFWTRIVYAVARPFLSAKIRERLCSHGSNLKSLLQIYHPDLLPKDFGGNLGPLNFEFYNTEMIQQLLNFIEKLKAEDQP